MNSGDILEIGTNPKNPEKIKDILEKFIKKVRKTFLSGRCENVSQVNDGAAG